MLQQIKINNFQSLENVTIPLGRCTVLKGKSDVGKTAVIRALKSCLTNTFKQEFAHNGILPIAVSITKDGRTVVGQRTSKGVSYKLDDIVFSKTAKKVPREIQDFIGIFPYACDRDQSVLFQIQSQFDKIFLLNETPATVAKIIGRVSNLNIVHMAMRQVYADQLENNQSIKYKQKRLAEVNAKLETYNHLDTLSEATKAAYGLRCDMIKLQDDHTELLQYAESLYKANLAYAKNHRKLIEVETALSSIASLEKSILEKEQLTEIVNILSIDKQFHIEPIDKALSFIDHIASSTDKYKSIMQDARSLFYINSRLSNISNKLANIDKAQTLSIPDVTELKALVSAGDKFKEQAKKFTAKLSAYHKEAEAIKEEVNSLQGTICPLTKQQLQSYCINYIKQ